MEQKKKRHVGRAILLTLLALIVLAVGGICLYLSIDHFDIDARYEAAQPTEAYDGTTVYAGDEAEIARVLSLPKADKYAVYGNHDLGGKAQHIYADIMAQAGYTVLVNQAVQLEGGVNLIGCDDLIFGTPDITGLPQEGALDLLLMHEPDFADRVTGVELQLSGHTHGGQVRLPFVDYLVLPTGGKNYIRGSFEKADGGLLYVNRGLGMSILPYRFASRPELTVIDLTGE